jgi:uncharacterized Ntn-hydrolase superfamily protein
MGCAVQSRYFAVGAVVPWGEADVGVVATQANVNVGYGPKGIQLLREGLTAEQVLQRLRDQDTFPGKEGRQVAIVDPKGNIAVYTGPEAASWAGHKKGANYSAQGNILTGPEVVDAMAEAFENTPGILAEKLVAALEAGQEAGGDRRGRQSAALLVVQKAAGRNTNNDVTFRLHVDDHATPIKELRRLFHIQLAMGSMRKSRQLFGEKEPEEALTEAERAVELWPNTSDTHLNLGLLVYASGDKDKALAVLKKASEFNPQFRDQLNSWIQWTGSQPLDEEFMSRLFPEEE